MGALIHRDVQETLFQDLRVLIREINSRLKDVAQAVTGNFRKPVALPFMIGAGIVGKCWVPTETFDILSFEFYTPLDAATYTMSGIVLNGVILTTDVAFPYLMASDSHIVITPVLPVRVVAGDDLTVAFSIQGTKWVSMSINVRRLG